MQAPKRTKHRKQQKGRRRGTEYTGNDVSFGDYGLLATASGWVTARQIEASRVAIMRKIRKYGRIWIRIFPDKPIGKKPAETRMGKGKGTPDVWVAVVRPGRMLFEVADVPEDMAKDALLRAAHKLSITTKIIKRNMVA
ncbi:MAG: 50S ribosomal protein L16 [Deltaproteobacteria bacterium]|nr:50S ribosomal protein L16 [Deltaproteobacteria bacterium]